VGELNNFSHVVFRICCGVSLEANFGCWDDLPWKPRSALGYSLRNRIARDLSSIL
jgi:hypothetical protein